MINNYSEVINYDEGDEYFDEFLKRVYLIDIFKVILEDYPNKETFFKIVKFILYGFSLESEMLTTNGLDWGKISLNIFKKIDLDEELYDEVGLLGNSKVREATHRWVQLQNDENYSQFVSYRGLRQQFLSVAALPMPPIEHTDPVTNKKSVDLDAYAKIKSIVEGKMTAVENAEELLTKMNDSKSAFIQNHPKLKTSINTFNNVASKKNTATVEDFINKR